MTALATGVLKRGSRRGRCRCCRRTLSIKARGLCGACHGRDGALDPTGIGPPRCKGCGGQLAVRRDDRHHSGLCHLCRTGSQSGKPLSPKLREALDLAGLVVMPCGPTGYPPGSAGKIACLMLRQEINAAYGRTRSLFRRDDWTN